MALGSGAGAAAASRITSSSSPAANSLGSPSLLLHSHFPSLSLPDSNFAAGATVALAAAAAAAVAVSRGRSPAPSRAAASAVSARSSSTPRSFSPAAHSPHFARLQQPPPPQQQAQHHLFAPVSPAHSPALTPSSSFLRPVPFSTISLDSAISGSSSRPASPSPLSQSSLAAPSAGASTRPLSDMASVVTAPYASTETSSTAWDGPPAGYRSGLAFPSPPAHHSPTPPLHTPIHRQPPPAPSSRYSRTTPSPSPPATHQLAIPIAQLPARPRTSSPKKTDASAWLDRSTDVSLFEMLEMELPTPQPAASLGFLSGQAAAPKNRIISKLDPAEEAKYLSAQVGEDSYFSRPEAVGVADGVGGWCQVKGANPALYSRKIMHYVSEELAAAEATRTDSEARHLRFDSRQLLQRAYSKASADAEKEGIVGSTTALVAVLEGDHLHVCSLGDCGLMVIRDGEAIFRTEEQQHSFNFPFQLGTSSKDGPSDAQCYCVPVRDNDVVIIGTDGIFDNVFDDEILEIVDMWRGVGKGGGRGGRGGGGGGNAATWASTGGAAGESRVHPKELAEALLRRAKEVASDPMNPNSPFQTRAVQEGLYYQGGKLDDVTVLASLIKTVSP